MNCLIGHFGDDEDDLGEALLQASAEFESPHATAPSLALAPSRAPGWPGSVLQHTPPAATKPTSSY